MEPSRSRGLFRDEVVREQARRLEGSVVFAQPVLARFAVPVLAVLTLAIGVFLAVAKYARTEHVPGYLAPSTGVSAIMAPRPGVVSQVSVVVGDRVKAGDLLMEIGSESTLASGAGLESSLREALLAQRGELDIAANAAQTLFEQQQQERQQRLQGLRRQLEQIAAQQRVASERVSITEDRRERFARLLEKGFVSRDQYQSKRDESLGVEQQLRDLEMTRLQLTGEFAQLQGAIAAAPRERDEKEANLRLRVSELEARLREIESRSSYAIKAPVAGKIAALQVHPGASVAPDAPVAVIMPEAGSLEVNLLVPTRAAGMIAIGQAVGVQYAAFPHEKFGIGRGRITHIETTVLAPAELKAPVSVQEPVYRVTAAIDDQAVRALGRVYPLQAGMLLDAQIVLEQRSLLEWIFEPLYRLRTTVPTA